MTNWNNFSSRCMPRKPFMMRTIDTKDIIDEEWVKFEADHFKGGQGKVKSKKVSFLKIAAMFIGVLMLSGIAYAHHTHYQESVAEVRKSRQE